MLKFTLRQIYQFKSIYNVTNVALHTNNHVLQSARLIPVNKTPNITATPQKLPPTETTEDRDYLVRLQNDPDVFGSDPKVEKLHEDDIKEEKFIENERQRGKRLSTKQYAEIIKSLIAKKKIKEACDVVEVRMLQEDRVKPDNYLYNLLLGACGRVGYTKKAFSLFNEMKRRGLAIHPGAYTALFNACANSPWAEDGLMRTKHLHNIMIEKRYEPNDTNYNAMIKAYGRWGDINTAFSLVDEMLAKKFPIKDETLNFLMQACISDKEAGFRHALLVWRKFIEKRIEPTTFSYNLLIRATRDCGLGNLDATRDVLKQILPEGDKFLQLEGRNEDIEKNVLSMGEIAGGKFQVDDTVPNVMNRPNLLCPVPYLGDIMILDEITKAEDRLLLLGGAKSFLDDMAKNNCKPNIKTYTQLLDCIPSTLTSEKELLGAMKKSKVHIDLDFYNMLIKKRSMRFDYLAAREVLDMIKDNNFMPDLITYGILALGCRTKEEAESFLYEMEAAKYRLNIEILGAMLQQSIFHFDFPYVLFVMDRCANENITPNAKFMEHLEKFSKKCKKISNDATSTLAKTKSFQKGFQIYRMRMKSWRDAVQPEVETHPWQQYRQPVETDVRHYKDTDKSTRFKPRHATLFKQKNVPTKVVRSNRPKKIGKEPFWKKKQEHIEKD